MPTVYSLFIKRIIIRRAIDYETNLIKELKVILSQIRSDFVASRCGSLAEADHVDGNHILLTYLI